MDTDLLIHSRRQFVTVFTGKHFDTDDNTGFTVGHTQRTVPFLTGLFVKYGTYKTFFRRQLGFTLRCNFSYKDITGAYFRTDPDDTALIQVFARRFRNVGDVPGDLFRSQLGVAGITVIFFNMN